MTTDRVQNPEASLAALASLYGALEHADLPSWLDAETLVAHLAGELSPALARKIDTALAGSPALRALVDAMAELAPDAETLVSALAARRVAAGHHRVHQSSTHHEIRRVRRQRHPGRWLGVAAAAALVAVAGVWSWQQVRPDAAGAMMATERPAAVQQQRVDAIFDSGMDQELAAHATAGDSDEIFNSNFSPRRS